MNWGNKLLFTFIVFAGGMIYLVFRSMHTTYELVEKDYYKTELRYQQVIDAANNTNMLATAASVQQTPDGILVQLPEEMKNKIVTGDILFYCAYDQKSDRKFSLRTGSDANQLLDPASVLPGIYSVKITWTCDGRNYFSERTLTVFKW